MQWFGTEPSVSTRYACSKPGFEPRQPHPRICDINHHTVFPATEFRLPSIEAMRHIYTLEKKGSMISIMLQNISFAVYNMNQKKIGV